MSSWRPDQRSAMSSWKADDAPPPLAHFLHAIDHAQMESLPSVNKDSVGVQEALRSYRREEQVREAKRVEEEQRKAEPKVESYPAFLNVQAPPAEYLEEVRQRRQRLMAIEKARRQARGRGKVPGYVPEAPATSSTSPVEPPVEPVRSPPPRATREAEAEASFAARVARVAREHPGAIGERQPQAAAAAAAAAASASSFPRERLSRNDFTGRWTDDAGNDYELVQSGSVVTERSRQSCGMAMRNELTMFGSIGTLVDDLIRWSDGSIWARQSESGASSTDLGSLGGFAWKAAARRNAPGRVAEMEELFSADVPADMVTPDVRQAIDGSEQRLWFAPWVQDGKQGL